MSLPDNGGQDSPEWTEYTPTTETSSGATYFTIEPRGTSVDKIYNVRLDVTTPDGSGRIMPIYLGLFNFDLGGNIHHGTLWNRQTSSENFAWGYLRLKSTMSLSAEQKNNAKIYIKEVI